MAVQNDLGSNGWAPVASNDTMNAEINRQRFVDEVWKTPEVTAEPAKAPAPKAEEVH